MIETWTRDLLFLSLALVIWFGIFLGSRPLNNPDEGRYTEIPREMVATGDYVTPRLNGVKYFEKPPLVYWLSALAIKVFGVNEWTARCWAAIFAMAGGLITYAAARSLYDRETGLWSAGVLATSILYYALSRLILLDLVVAVLISGSLFAFVMALRQPSGAARRNLFWAFYVGMALATLTKGLIGFVLPGAVTFLWVLLLNQWSRLRPFYPWSGVMLFLVVAAPWHVLAARANSDFLYFYFVHEHLQRFTTTLHGRVQPWWFFLPVLIGGLFPWAVFAVQAAMNAVAGGWRERRSQAETWFLVIWIVVIFVFFSKSQSKLIPYILPVFPAVAVLLGRYLARALREAASPGLRAGLWIAASVLLALALTVTLAKLPKNMIDLTKALTPWRWALGLGSGATAGFIVIALLRQKTRFALGALGVGCALFFMAANPLAGLLDTRSTKDLAILLKQQLKPDDRVFVVGEYFQDFPVYLNRLVSVVDYEGELAFGIHAEPEATTARFLSRDRFLEQWREPRRQFAIARKRDIAALLAGGAFPYVVLGEYREQLLLANGSVDSGGGNAQLVSAKERN